MRSRSLPAIVSVLERSERRSYGVTVEGVPVELVVAEPARFGTELVRATGSPEYVAALEPLPAAPDEESVYRALGIPFCPPELREQPFRGEPPPLVELAQIRGDLHAHTTWSDGRASVEEMALAAIERGYEYLAICDHTPAVGAVRGLTADDLRRQALEITDVERCARAVPRPPWHRVRHPPGRTARPARFDPRGAGLGAGERPRRPAAAEARPDEAGRGGAAQPARRLPLAPEGPVHQPPARERARHRPADRGRARGGTWRWR